MRTLFRAPNWVGDVVMSLPALKALRGAFPKDELAVLARPWVADLYRLRPDVDRVIVEEVRGKHAGRTGQDRLAATLAEGRFDRAVILPTSFHSAWTAWRAGIPVRIGYRGEFRGALLTRSVRLLRAAGEHQVFKHLRLVAAAGVEGPLLADISWEVPRRERDSARRLLAKAGWDGGPFVAVHLASFAHAAKRWDLSRFAAVLDSLALERPLTPVLLGSEAEKGMNAEAAVLMGRTKTIDLSGASTLPQVLGLLAEAALFIGNDSGLSHLSAAAGTPTLVIFGPTDPDATRPWDGPRSDGRPPRVTVVRRAPFCAPCGFRVCPIDHSCMRGVPAEAVLGAARALLG